MRAILQTTIFWGIKIWQVMAFLLFYLFFAFQYWMAIWYTTGHQQNMWKEALIDYFLLKLALTIPLWGLYFKVWQNKSIVFKIGMHLITGPIWIFC